MKKLTSFFLLLSSLILISCANEDDVDCSQVSCLVPGILFEFVDENTNENLIENGSIEAADIKFNVSSVQASQVRIEERAGQVYLFLSNWPEGEHEVELLLDSRSLLELEISTDNTETDCCSGVEITDLEISKGKYEEIGDQLFRIFIDQSE